ncbi:MAG: DegQ family serine endoprotease [Kiloniellales bacterium]
MLAAVAATALTWGPAFAEAKAPPESFADLAEALLPAVVNISTTQKVRGPRPEMPQFPPGSPFEEFFKEFFDRQQRRGAPRRSTSLGSGFIIASDGYVVTNNHVIEGAEEITVTLQDNTELEAEIVGRDIKTDIALLKVEPEGELPFVSFGDSDELRVGDWVIAIGNPLNFGGTVTAGIVSARGREIGSGPYDDFIQTDASINRGNSGGPLFNLDGKVIGINTAIFSPTGGSIGIGFSIPAALAQPVIDQLRQFGRTRRGWLGVRIQFVTDEIAESLGLGMARGALVASVTEGGPAERAQIEAGDVILSFDGKPIKRMRELPRIVADTPPDRKVPVTVWRKGVELTLDVTIAELEEYEQATLVAKKADEADSDIEALGLSLAALSVELRERFELEDSAAGVVVTDIRQDSAAARKGLRPGDLIVEVGQEEVSAPGDVAQKVAKAKEDGRKSVLLLVDRQGDLRFVALRVDQG